MNDTLYIYSWCSIRGRTVLKDGGKSYPAGQPTVPPPPTSDTPQTSPVANASTTNGSAIDAAPPPISTAEFLTRLYRFLGVDYPKFYKMDSLSKLGWLTAEFLLQDQPLEDIAPESVALVVANANSSLDTDRKYLESTKTIASPALFVYTLPNILLGEICIRRGFKGENAFFVFPEFDTVFLEEYVGGLFAGSATELCCCGWVDLLEDRLDAALFLVGASPAGLRAGGPTPLPFTAGHLQELYSKTS